MSNCYFCGPSCQPGCTYLKPAPDGVSVEGDGTVTLVAKTYTWSPVMDDSVDPNLADKGTVEIGDGDTITFSNYSDAKAFSVEELKESVKRMKEISEKTIIGRDSFTYSYLRNAMQKDEFSIRNINWYSKSAWVLLEPNSYSEAAEKFTKIARNPITDDRKRNEHLLSEYEKVLMGEVHNPLDNWFLRVKDEVTRLDSRITLELEYDNGSTYLRARTVFENQPEGRQRRDRDWLVNGPAGPGYMYVQDKPEQAAKRIVEYWKRRRQIADDKLTGNYAVWE